MNVCVCVVCVCVYTHSQEINVKNKKYDEVYEGVAQVVVAYPLTVQYLKPDGNKVVSQVDLKDQHAILAGRFIKIVVEGERVVEIKDEVVM